MTALPRIDIDRLTKVCGLFSSDHDGERASAAAFADRIVRGAGLTWEQLLTAPPPGPKMSRRHDNARMTPGVMLARYGDSLTGWERGFLTSLIRRPRPWSPRQNEVLAEIRERVRGLAT